tara:strand:- start:235 stop:618 length:384 start_codon:yes stop_codon:yes gene_type:complete
VGDFNIALEDRDIYDPKNSNSKIMATDKERQILRDILSDRLQDVFRLFEPNQGYWSWWDYRNRSWDRDKGWRIDHIYLSNDLLEFARGCAIDKQLRGNKQPSDHVPVIVDLAWPPEEEMETDLDCEF